MTVFACWYRIPDGARRITNVETDHADVAALVADLQARGVVAGVELLTRPAGEGLRAVVERRPMALTPRSFDTIRPALADFIEDGEAKA